MSHTKIQDGYNEFTPIKQPIEIPPRITDRAWVNHIRNIWNRFNEMLDPITGNIKKGTLLFHGSLDPAFDIFSPGEVDRPVFFGLDPYIAIWYIYEMAARDWRANGRGVLWSTRPKKYFSRSRPPKRRKGGTLGPCNGIGYLYVYKLTKDIPKENIHRIPLLQNNPKDDQKCFGRAHENRKTVCVHPQIAYHGFAPGGGPTAPLQDLSFEITLRPNEYEESIKSVRKQMVNILELHIHEDDRLYDALEALYPPEHLEPDDCEYFLERNKSDSGLKYGGEVPA
tara:strand:- start:41 stop:886 length:846 start_codon:yes stop_codon:yes gene_type:complete